MFTLDPEETLGLEEVIYRVLEVIKSNCPVGMQRLHVNVWSDTDPAQTESAHLARCRRTKNDPPRTANKYGQSFCLSICVDNNQKRGTQLLEYKWPLINGMSVHAVGTFIAKRIKQLLMMSHTLALKVDEFGCEYWYVYPVDTKNVEEMR